MITQEELKRIYTYSPETGEFKVNPESNSRRTSCGWKDKQGYLRVYIHRRMCGLHRLAWLYHYGRMPVGLVDHVNGDRSDNRICNLRESTQSENLMNSKRSSKNTSGVKGVSWINSKQRWVACVTVERKRHVIGQYLDLHEAENAVRRARSELHGDFARHG